MLLFSIENLNRSYLIIGSNEHFSNVHPWIHVYLCFDIWNANMVFILSNVIPQFPSLYQCAHGSQEGRNILMLECTSV